jgi:hypothetical protein
MRRLGLWIAMAAVVVATPRLVLTLLAGERIGIGSGPTAALIAISGAGAAVVLSAGQLYIVHVVGTVQRRLTLAVLWAGILLMTAVLVVPMIIAGLEARTLPEVLTHPRSPGWPGRWAWAATAVLAVELAAAVCVYAARLHGREAEQRAELEQQLCMLRAELAAARQALAQQQARRARRAVQNPESTSSSEVPCRHGCGFMGSAMGERAHQRFCPQRSHIEPPVSGSTEA